MSSLNDGIIFGKLMKHESFKQVAQNNPSVVVAWNNMVKVACARQETIIEAYDQFQRELLAKEAKMVHPFERQLEEIKQFLSDEHIILGNLIIDDCDER